MKILINALTLHQGGGKTILLNLIKNIQINENDNYTILVDNREEYLLYNKNNIKIISLNKIFQKQFLLPLTFILIIPILIKMKSFDKIFNFSDAPIYTKVFQIFYFDWAFMVYPEEFIYRNFNHKEKFRIFIKKKVFLLGIKFINKLIVQTPVIKKRFTEQIDRSKLPEILVIPVGRPSFKVGEKYKLKNTSHFKLLCLTNYYKHKNLESLIDVAQIIKEKKLNITIFLTLSENNGDSIQFLNSIKTKGLSNIIINLGTVKYEDLYGLYKAVDASILPTLIESYSSTYIESISFKKPILTSDYDFTRYLCGNCALYFDPFSSQSIYNSIIMLKEKKIYNKLIDECNQISNRNYSWQVVTSNILKQ